MRNSVRTDRLTQSQYAFGITASLVGHVLLALLTIVILERNAESALRPQEVFSVTLEGGEVLGGISQVPKPGAKKILTQAAADEEDGKSVTPPEPPKTSEPEKQSKAVKDHSTPEQTKEEISLKAPSGVDDPEKILAARKLEEEKKKKAEEEKKKAEEAKKKAEEEKKKKAEEEKKRKAEEEREKKLEDEKKAEEQKKKADDEKKKHDRAERDKQLADIVRKMKDRYEGESADAGGKGFGAAAEGGKGMGGGTLASAEKIAYQNALQQAVKQGWHWMNTTDHLVARVQVTIQPNGVVQDVNIVQASGNRNFDDSVVRAVFKASPLPPAPADLYSQFSNVTFSFDSKE